MIEPACESGHVAFRRCCKFFYDRQKSNSECSGNTGLIQLYHEMSESGARASVHLQAGSDLMRCILCSSRHLSRDAECLCSPDHRSHGCSSVKSGRSPCSARLVQARAPKQRQERQPASQLHCVVPASGSLISAGRTTQIVFFSASSLHLPVWIFKPATRLSQSMRAAICSRGTAGQGHAVML